MLRYLLTYSNVNFSGVIWHCATEINSIQLHDSFVLVTLESVSLQYITLHYITLQINTTATKVYFRHSRFIWAPPSCFVGCSISRHVRVTGEAGSRRCVRFADSRGPAKPAFCRYWREKLVIPERFTVKEGPPSFIWGEVGSQQWGGTIIPVYSWHTHSKRAQNTQKRIKSLNYLSLLRFSLLLPNCEGSHSAFIYKFEDANSNTHASMKGPSRPNMSGGVGHALRDGCASFGGGPFVTTARPWLRHASLDSPAAIVFDH